MSTVLDRWLKSSKPAEINSHMLRPLQNPSLSGTVLGVERGQAQAYFVEDEKQRTWVIKKFLQGRDPGISYLQSIAGVLPTHPALVVGTERRVLSSDDLGNADRSYHDQGLADWLNGAVLMPAAVGEAWSSLADDLREGDITLPLDARLALACELANVIHTLEKSECSHRDLSSGNVFVNLKGNQIALIDFDGVYHDSLARPSSTTAGTEGYIPSFVWKGENPDVTNTYTACADRFALAVLVAELIVMDRDSPLFGDGGLLDQSDIRARRGKSINHLTERLNKSYRPFTPLFEKTLNAKSFEGCPTPRDWINACKTTKPVQKLTLTDLEDVSPKDFALLLEQVRQGNAENKAIANRIVFPTPELPNDPWAA